MSDTTDPAQPLGDEPAQPSAMPPPSLTAPARPARSPDPGSRTAATIATILALVLVPVVIFLQQAEPREPTPPHQASTAPAADADQFSVVGKMLVKMYFLFKDVGQPNDQRTIAQMFRSNLDSAANPGKSGMAMGTTLDTRTVRLNRLHAAIAAGEFDGGDAALKELDDLAATPPPEEPPSQTTSTPAPSQDKAEPAPAPVPAEQTGADSPADAGPETIDIAPDLEPLRLVYSGRAAELTDAQRTALVDRHGWWGRLALSYGLPDTDPARAPLVSGGGRVLAVLSLVCIIVVLFTVAAVVCCIIMLIKLGSGSLRRRFVPPAPGGSVYLETLAVFAASFIALKVGLTAAVKLLHVPPGAAIGAQWLLVAVPLWPVLRAVPFRAHRRLIGWHSGAGVLREIGCGLLAYFAGLVLFVGAILVSIMILFARMTHALAEGRKEPPPRNPVVEELLRGSAWEVLMLMGLAVVWAPIVEEAVFRGSFFRHLRSRLGVVAAAIVSGTVFGVMHPYPWFLFLPVITLGFIFALMREWRGSLIAPMTAHALHNATLVSILVLVLWAMKD